MARRRRLRAQPLEGCDRRVGASRDADGDGESKWVDRPQRASGVGRGWGQDYAAAFELSLETKRSETRGRASWRL